MYSNSALIITMGGGVGGTYIAIGELIAIRMLIQRGALNRKRRSLVIMLICRDHKYRNQTFALIYSFCLEKGVMMMPKRRLLTLIFVCLWFENSLLINGKITQDI